MTKQPVKLRRRDLMILTAAMLAVDIAPTRAKDTMSVLKTSGCVCCVGWVKRMKEAGFVVEARNVSMGELMKYKLDRGLKPELASCHTGTIAGYLIEGHVPAREITRLLADRPGAIGLAVPGMPLGSPGMESGSELEPYEVLLVRKDSSTEVFARYG